MAVVCLSVCLSVCLPDCVFVLVCVCVCVCRVWFCSGIKLIPVNCTTSEHQCIFPPSELSPAFEFRLSVRPSVLWGTTAWWDGPDGIEASSLGNTFLQCFDAVGWLIWPVKTRPRYDCNVFGGTLNLALSVYLPSELSAGFEFRLCPSVCLSHWWGTPKRDCFAQHHIRHL